MKLFVSIPMTGIEDTVMARFNRAKALIESDSVLSQYEIVTPYRMLEVFDENGLVEGIKNDNKTTGYAMGKNIQLVIGCDAIYSCDGWRNSKGCKVERYTAEMYGLKLFEEVEGSLSHNYDKDNGFRSQPYGELIRGKLSGYKNLIAVLQHIKSVNDIGCVKDMLSVLDLDNEEAILGDLVDLSKEIDSLAPMK